MIKIRNAEVKDIEEIVDVMFRTWRTTYTGIVNEKYMFERESKRKEKITRMKNVVKKGEIEGVKINHCIATYNGKIIGFAVYGKCREEDNYDFKNTGEIYALYVLKENQGQGIGKKLVNFAVVDLISKYYEKVIIWALKDNPSINFYKKIGGDGKLAKNIKMSEQILAEIGFVYDDINKLFKNTKSYQK